MNVQAIYRILGDCCAPFRKGEIETREQVGPMEVVTINAFPAASEVNMDGTHMMVDCHFITIGVHLKLAIQHRQEFIDAIDDDADMLGGGPSYITLGGMLGDQTAAFCFMAVGQALGLWRVVTPAKLHLPEDMHERAAGLGYIMISGYRKGGIHDE